MEASNISSLVEARRLSCSSRRGVALLEVIVSLTILVITSAAFTVQLSQALMAVARSQSDEALYQQADALLVAASLWPRADLDRRLGSRRQGPWLLTIHRHSPTIYDISVADTSDAERPLLTTSVYRPVRTARPTYELH